MFIVFLDDKVEFSVTLAIKSIKKNCKLFYSLNIVKGNSFVSFPIIMLRGLHFDILPGVNWIRSVKAVTNTANNTLVIEDMVIKCSYWPKLSSYLLLLKSLLILKNAVLLNPS